MPVIGYKPQCEARKRGTFYYSDFKFPCKKDEFVPEEDLESFENSKENFNISEFNGEDLIASEVLSYSTVEKEEVEKKLKKKVRKKKQKEKHFEVFLNPEDPPCYTPIPHNYDVDFLKRWKEKEKENFGRAPVICPKAQDRYEESINEPLVPPRPPPTPSPPRSETFLKPCTSLFPSFDFGLPEGPEGTGRQGIPGGLGRMRAHLKGNFRRDIIPTIPCLLCDGSLYENGYVHDLHDKVEKIKQESLLKDDEIVRKIGIKTRITVHKLCYEEYIKRPLNAFQEEPPTIYS